MLVAISLKHLINKMVFGAGIHFISFHCPVDTSIFIHCPIFEIAEKITNKSIFE